MATLRRISCRDNSESEGNKRKPSQTPQAVEAGGGSAIGVGVGEAAVDGANVGEDVLPLVGTGNGGVHWRR